MIKGQVIYYSYKRGFGKIKGNESEKEFFVHFSDIQSKPKKLQKNDLVEFDILETEKGPKAINVTIINGRPNEQGAKTKEQPGFLENILNKFKNLFD